MSERVTRSRAVVVRPKTPASTTNDSLEKVEVSMLQVFIERNPIPSKDDLHRFMKGIADTSSEDWSNVFESIAPSQRPTTVQWLVDNTTRHLEPLQEFAFRAHNFFSKDSDPRVVCIVNTDEYRDSIGMLAARGDKARGDKLRQDRFITKCWGHDWKEHAEPYFGRDMFEMTRPAWCDLAKIARYPAFESDMQFALEVMGYELQKRMEAINATKRVNAKGVLVATKSFGRQVKAVAPQDLRKVLKNMSNKDYLETIRLELVKQGKTNDPVQTRNDTTAVVPSASVPSPEEKSLVIATNPAIIRSESAGTVPSTHVSSSLPAAASGGNRRARSPTVESEASPSPPARKSVGGKSVAMLKMIMEAENKEDSGQEDGDSEEAVEDSEEEVDDVDEDVDDDEEDEDTEDGEEEGHDIVVGQVGEKRPSRPYSAAGSELSTAESKDDRAATHTRHHFSVVITKTPTETAESRPYDQDCHVAEEESLATPATIPPPVIESVSLSQDGRGVTKEESAVVPEAIATLRTESGSHNQDCHGVNQEESLVSATSMTPSETESGPYDQDCDGVTEEESPATPPTIPPPEIESVSHDQEQVSPATPPTIPSRETESGPYNQDRDDVTKEESPAMPQTIPPPETESGSYDPEKESPAATSTIPSPMTESVSLGQDGRGVSKEASLVAQATIALVGTESGSHDQGCHGITKEESPATAPTIPPPETESVFYDLGVTEMQPPDTLATVLPPSKAIEPVFDDDSDQSTVSSHPFVVPKVKLPSADDIARVAATGRGGKELWVNDAAVDAYLEMLANHVNSHSGRTVLGVLSSHFWGWSKTRSKLFGSTEAGFDVAVLTTILLPRRENGNHWQLLVLDRERKEIRLHCTLGGKLNDETFGKCKTFLALLDPEGQHKGEKWKPGNTTCLQQKDGNSCGILVMEHARRIVLDQSVKEVDVSEKGIQALRARMASELSTGILQDLEAAISAPPPSQTASPVATPFPVSQPVASVVSATPAFSPLVPETPRGTRGGTTARGGYDAAAAVKHFVPETPRRLPLFSFPAISKETLQVPLEVPEVMPSAPGADDCSEWEHSLGQAAEEVLGTGCVERLRDGETITFQVFPEGFDRRTIELLVAEVGMYIYHSPVALGCEDVLPNMVHSVLQQAVRQSLAVWVVSALLYCTERVIAIPLPGIVSVKDGLWDVDESHIFDASVSLKEGIKQPWTGLHMEPVWYPDDINPTVGSIRIGTKQQWSGLQAIQQAYVSLGAVQLDMEGFNMADFSDSFAMPAILPCSISRAMLGAVSWEHQSVSHFLASTRTMDSFSSQVQTQTEFAPGLAAAAAKSLQQEYIRFGRSSWVVACAKAGRKKDTGWLSTIVHILGDRWIEAWLAEEGAEVTTTASGTGAKRAANFTDTSPLAKKVKV